MQECKLQASGPEFRFQHPYKYSAMFTCLKSVSNGGWKQKDIEFDGCQASFKFSDMVFSKK